MQNDHLDGWEHGYVFAVSDMGRGGRADGGLRERREGRDEGRAW